MKEYQELLAWADSIYECGLPGMLDFESAAIIAEQTQSEIDRLTKERDMAIHHLRELTSDSRHVYEGTNALQSAREFLQFIGCK